MAINLLIRKLLAMLALATKPMTEEKTQKDSPNKKLLDIADNVTNRNMLIRQVVTNARRLPGFDILPPPVREREERRLLAILQSKDFPLTGLTDLITAMAVQAIDHPTLIRRAKTRLSNVPTTETANTDV